MSGLVLGLHAGQRRRGQDRDQDGGVQGGRRSRSPGACLAYDDAVPGKRPGVLVFPEWWGLVDFPKQKAEQLAKMGYVALAVDMYGQGQTTDDPQQAAKLAAAFQPTQMRQRAAGRPGGARGRRWSTRDGSPRSDSASAAMWHCRLAYSGADIRAAVDFHGDLTPPSAEEASNQGPDPASAPAPMTRWSRPEGATPFGRPCGTQPRSWQINVYSGAKHSFTNPAADKYDMKGVGHNAVAAERAWSACSSSSARSSTRHPYAARRQVVALDAMAGSFAAMESLGCWGARGRGVAVDVPGYWHLPTGYCRRGCCRTRDAVGLPCPARATYYQAHL